VRLIVGTRGSMLARTQTDWVVAKLRAAHPGVEFETRIIVTGGDRLAESAAPASAGGKGIFVKEIEDALLRKEIDLAVHSMKDVPGELAPGLIIAATPPREDVRDAWISRDGRTFETIASGARVGSTSLRRQALIRRLRPDLKLLPFRGNIDTRLRKVQEGVVDATVLAVAGLNRAGLRGRITSIFSLKKMIPAAGQGALAIETRAADKATGKIVRAVNDPLTLGDTFVERRLVTLLGGSCNSPIGVHARTNRLTGRTVLRAVVLTPDGSRAAAAERGVSMTELMTIADAVYADLVKAGAKEILGK
jgi:hydroxymethylbilane synthase